MSDYESKFLKVQLINAIEQSVIEVKQKGGTIDDVIKMLEGVKRNLLK